MDHDDQAGGFEEGAAGSNESPGLQSLLEKNNREEIRVEEPYFWSPRKFIFEVLRSYQLSMASMAPEAFALLSTPLKGLLQETGISTPTPPQVEAIPLIAQGDNVLIIAPTGSGKTEAALLPLIDRMIRNNDRQGISLVYITPLRALNRDLLKRLQTWSSKLGFSVEVRHGDTPAKDRRRMAVKPPDLLITTPETLQAVLPGKRMRDHLRHVKSVVVDEIHELAGDRRGVQLTVGLERLREICVNSRVNAELLGSKFNMMDRKIMVHHGSLPREERVRAEEAFKGGEIKGLVCTSTLELGIDIGSVDLVVQYMSPRQVNSLVQRVGRSGHTLTRTSQGVLVSVSTEDILESVGVIELAMEGRLEHTIIHLGALDVLAHQIAGVLMDSEGSLEILQAKNIIKRAYPYHELEDGAFDKVIEFMRKMGYLKKDDSALYRTSRTRFYYFENLSMIPDERRYLVVDLTSQQNVGILGEEFMITKARIGLNFIVKGRVWQIKQITDDAKVYVLRINDPTAAIPGWDGQILPVARALATKVGAYRAIVERNIAQHAPKSISVERLSQLWPADVYGLKRVVEEIEAHKATGAAVPTDQRVLIEGFDRYIILHTHLGDIVNFTLGEVIEELFRRQGIVRMWWSDAYRILFEMNADTSDLELEELFREQIFGVEETVLGGACHGVLHRHFPWQLYMKHIAERFGALNRGRLMYGDAMKELMLRYRLTPIYDETIREALMEHSDFDAVKEIFLRIKKGSMEVQFFQSKERRTPLAYHILYRHVDVPELIAPENVAADNLARLRISIEGRVTDMLCFDCGILDPEILISDLPDHPQCTSCGSRLLAPLFWSSHYAADIVKKKRNRENLDENEQKVLARARRSADLVISYGRRAVIAQSVYGIGPQTASRILATMRDREEEFYQDLLDAKLHFIATRPYWNN